MHDHSTASVSGSWLARVRASAWAPLVTKLVGLSALLAALGLLGSGAFDRWVSPRSASAASMAHARPGAPTRATGTALVAEPTIEAPQASSTSSTHAEPTASGSSMTPEGKLILNLATAADLDRLPGIGLRKAQAIVDLRTKLGGRFKRLEELMRVRGIKRKFLDRLRPLVVLDAAGG